MKTQQVGQPEVNLSWIIEDCSYSHEHNKTTLSSEKGREQLVNTILMLLGQDREIRIGTDGFCLILEANEVDDEHSNASYQWIDDDHYIEEYCYLSDSLTEDKEAK